MIKMIVAVDDANLIGCDSKLPWHNSDDLKFFKKTTLNHDILVGRITFESIGRVLPNRHSYVLTRDRNYQFDHEDVTIIHDLDHIMDKYQDKDLFVIGGAKIYELMLDKADEIIISRIPGIYEGDTYFPKFDKSKYEVRVEIHQTFSVEYYKKK